MEVTSSHCVHGGEQRVYRHDSAETHCAMEFGAFLPPAALKGEKRPCVIWLSGLTCTHENFVTKAGAQRAAAELELMLIAPDTSPRGPDLEGGDVPDDPGGGYDFGLGAGFYVDATEEPWARHYRMRSYVEKELPALLGEHLPVDLAHLGVAGHSMGGPVSG